MRRGWRRDDRYFSPERQQLALNSDVPHRQPSHRDRQRETPGPRAPRIEQEDAVPHFPCWLVRVARYDRGEARRSRLKVERLDVVEDIEQHAADLDDLSLVQRVCPGSVVVVTAHGGHGRDGAESGEYLGRADVTGVDDQVGVGERGERFGAD